MEPGEHLGYFLKHPEDRGQFPKVNCGILPANAEGAQVEKLIIRPQGKRVLLLSEGLSKVSPTTEIISSIHEYRPAVSCGPSLGGTFPKREQVPRARQLARQSEK